MDTIKNIIELITVVIAGASALAKIAEIIEQQLLKKQTPGLENFIAAMGKIQDTLRLFALNPKK